MYYGRQCVDVSVPEITKRFTITQQLRWMTPTRPSSCNGQKQTNNNSKITDCTCRHEYMVEMCSWASRLQNQKACTYKATVNGACSYSTGLTAADWVFALESSRILSFLQTFFSPPITGAWADARPRLWFTEQDKTPKKHYTYQARIPMKPSTNWVDNLILIETLGASYG